jgi:hypothetical protein
MNTTVVLEVLLVVALIFYRQLRVQRVKDNLVKLPLILGALGVINAANFLQDHKVSPGEIVGVIAGLIIAAVIALPRARSVQVWRENDGTWMRRGTPVTIGWWLVALAGHAVTAFAGPLAFGETPHGYSGFESATIMVYLGVSLGAQGWFLEQRLQRSLSARRSSAIQLAK